MIDYKDLLAKPDKYQKGSLSKGISIDVDAIVSAHDKFVQQQQLVESIRQKSNHNAANIKRSIDDSGKPDLDLVKIGKDLRKEIAAEEAKLESYRKDFYQRLAKVPNLPSADTPEGRGEDDNVEIRRVGVIRDFSAEGFQPKTHLELMENLDLVDFTAGAKVSGSQFYFLKNEAVLLEQALIAFALKKLQSRGYVPIITPDLVRKRYYLGTGYQPQGDEAQIYEIDGEDLGLIATAEISMAGYHADEVLAAEELPKRYVAISHCFRKEAGAYGKYSKGLYRVHQFTKVEMFAYCLPEDNESLHQEFLAVEEEITSELGLPYRVLQMCSGDLGAIASKKYDLEAWMPGRNDYGEITSASIVNDYQSRNLNIKYRLDGSNNYVHMLNGTAIVSSRFPVAIIENFQQADGSIVIPEVLQDFMGMDRISRD